MNNMFFFWFSILGVALSPPLAELCLHWSPNWDTNILDSHPGPRVEGCESWKNLLFRRDPQELRDVNSCVICHHKARAPITAGTVTGSVEESLVAGSIFQPLSQIHISNAGRRTDFWDKKSSDFSGEIFRRGISGEALLPLNFVPINWLWSGFIFPELEHL